jgi:hypothetical protein
MEKDIRREVPAATAGDGREPEGSFASDGLAETGTLDPEMLEKPVPRRSTCTRRSGIACAIRRGGRGGVWNPGVFADSDPRLISANAPR